MILKMLSLTVKTALVAVPLLSFAATEVVVQYPYPELFEETHKQLKEGAVCDKFNHENSTSTLPRPSTSTLYNSKNNHKYKHNYNRNSEHKYTHTYTYTCNLNQEQ